MLAINYIHTGNSLTHTHTQGRFNNHAVHGLYRILIMATDVMGVITMGNIMPRAGIEPTSLTYWASVLPLRHVGALMSPLYPRLPVYAAPCLGGQCRLLHNAGCMLVAPLTAPTRITYTYGGFTVLLQWETRLLAP